MAGQMFMRVDEVAEELGVSKPYLKAVTEYKPPD